jgi:hypothetical protein
VSAPDRILTPEQVGAIVQRTARSVTALCAKGLLPGARKWGRCWRIPESAIAAYFALPADVQPQAPSEAPRAEQGRPVASVDSDVARLHRRLLAKAGRTARSKGRHS